MTSNSAVKPAAPSVAHVCVPFLQATETFIYDRITHHEKYSPFVLTDEPPVNLDLFPFSPIYSLSDLSPLARGAQNAWRRASGYLPFYLDVLKRERPSVIHAHYGPIGAAIASLRRKAGIPLVTSFYGIDASAFLSDPKHSAGFSRLWCECDIVSVLSADMRDKLAAAGCPQEKMRIHHLAVDIEAVRPAEVPPVVPPPLIVACASRLIEKKGLDTLLRAAAIINKDIQIKVRLVGTGPLEKSLRALAGELGLAAHVEFIGRRTRTEVFEIMSAAHIFALLSRTAADGDSEGTPTALIEAGALALPCVSTRHAGIPEVIDDGMTGLLVDENDYAAAARAMLKLAGDENLRKKMGAAARNKIESEFSIKEVVRRMEMDYDEAVKNFKP